MNLEGLGDPVEMLAQKLWRQAENRPLQEAWRDDIATNNPSPKKQEHYRRLAREQLAIRSGE